ncbi:ARID DNA-binding domain-containing protein [Tanacetum coccineum]
MSESWKPPRKLSEKEYYQRQINREKEERVRRCVRQISQGCKGMLKKKLEEIEAFNSSLHQNKLEKNKCFYCRQKWHLIRTCPKKIMNDAESSQDQQNQSNGTAVNQSNTAQPEFTLKYPEFIHFNTDGILKGTDQGSWDDFWESTGNMLDLNKLRNMQNTSIEDYFEGLNKNRFEKKDEMARFVEDVNPTEVHTFQEFVGFLNLIKDDNVALAEAVKDSSLESYQWSVGKNDAPSTSQKGKEKIEHFGIKLKDKPVCIQQ